MSFVIYNAKTFARHKASVSGAQSFPHERVAKAVRTKAKLDPAEWLVADYDTWCAADPEVEVDSVMGGKVKIRASERGNPAVDPSMEGYWSA